MMIMMMNALRRKFMLIEKIWNLLKLNFFFLIIIIISLEKKVFENVLTGIMVTAKLIL